MKKIESFTVNHLVLEPGVYVSRKDHIGKEVITTFDLRMTTPNKEPVMNTAEVHTIEHLGATYLRNDPEYHDKTIYFGPMGCRTGFYMSVIGVPSEDAVKVAWTASMKDILGVKNQEDIPELNKYQCGTYKMHSLDEAHAIASKILERGLITINNEEIALDVAAMGLKKH